MDANVIDLIRNDPWSRVWDTAPVVENEPDQPTRAGDLCRRADFSKGWVCDGERWIPLFEVNTRDD